MEKRKIQEKTEHKFLTYRYKYIGNILDGLVKYFEMVKIEKLNKLYNILDLYIVSSRTEGGPQAIVECGITKTPVVSTNVGIAEEILSPESIYDIDEFYKAEPNVEYAFNKSKELTVPKGMKKYVEMFEDIYEN